MYGAGEYDNGFGLDAFQTLVGVAQAQPQVVIATVVPPAAQEGPQEEDESPDGLPDGLPGQQGAQQLRYISDPFRPGSEMYWPQANRSANRCL